jgi:hypothetical protein
VTLEDGREIWGIASAHVPVPILLRRPAVSRYAYPSEECLVGDLFSAPH